MSDQAPMVPLEVDLRDLQWMPLDVVRLRDSGLASDETPEACWAAVLLWCAAWHQVPAASIPDNEQWQAKACGYVARGRIDPAWKQVRDGALRNFVMCSDGRLYHTHLAAKALESWQWKQSQRSKTAAATLARKARYEAAKASSRSEMDQRDVEDVREESERDVQKNGPPDRTGPDRTYEEQENHSPPAQGAGTAYGEITRRLRQAGISRVNPGELRFRALVDAGATAEEFLAYVDRSLDKGDAFAWLIGAVEGERKRAAATASQLHRGPMPKADDRKSRQLETAALMTGAARVRQAPDNEPETIDVASRIIPA